jgi:Tol biopolymer transport system component
MMATKVFAGERPPHVRSPAVPRRPRWLRRGARAIRTVLFVLAVLAQVLPGQEAAATIPGRNGRIVFTSLRQQRVNIYTMRSDGSSVRKVTDTRWLEQAPSWSPDGRWIVFSGERHAPADLFAVRANGNELTRLTESRSSESWPAWSPDGDLIAFVCWRGTNPYQICTITADGTNRQRLTHYPVDGAGDPAWSPDAARIAFDHAGGIYTMRPNGTHVRRIPNTPEDSFEPSWSSDGRTIAFIGRTDGRYDLFTIRVDGTHLRTITRTPLKDEHWPSWSPNGRRIAYERVWEREEPGFEYHVILSIRPDGTGRRKLSSDRDLRDGEPEWQTIT